jgi:hypothetical protein
MSVRVMGSDDAPCGRSFGVRRRAGDVPETVLCVRCHMELDKAKELLAHERENGNGSICRRPLSHRVLFAVLVQ